MVGVIAKFKVKEGKADEVVKLFEEIVPHVRQEEGTLFYTLNRDTANPNILIVMERYKDKDALRFHSKTPHFLALFPKMGPLLEENPEISVLDELVSI